MGDTETGYHVPKSQISHTVLAGVDMTYKVPMREIRGTYYRYVRQALQETAGLKPIWQLNFDEVKKKALEDKCFENDGIVGLLSIPEPAARGQQAEVEFKDQSHFMFWLLRWS
jgi:hypothetical protein